jgi:predicted nuclease with TOPRIM domain
LWINKCCRKFITLIYKSCTVYNYNSWQQNFNIQFPKSVEIYRKLELKLAVRRTIWSKTPHESEHEWTRVNTNEHEWTRMEHEWTRMEHVWTRMEHEWTRMEHEWTRMEHEWTQMEHEWIHNIYTWKMSQTYSGSVHEIITD